MARPIFDRLERFDLPEVFADGFEAMLASDGCIYITLSARRVEGAPAGKPPRAKQVTCCRLVLTVPAAGLLMDQLANLFEALKQQGIVNRDRGEPQTVQ